MNSPDIPGALVRNRRILVVDDNAAIHEDVRKILCPTVTAAASALAAFEAELLGVAPTGAAAATSGITVDSAFQGREALALVERAVAAGQPYAMAFVDVRMPPGWDGVETTLALWKVAPDLQVVICTAYSDYSWDDLLERLGATDRLVILKKPFDTIEVLQLANALTEKWNLLAQTRRHAAELEERVHARTADLENEIARRAAVEADLVRAKDAAEAADRAKSAFLANMSHEIRTPMNGVVGMANLLQSTPLNAEQRDFVGTLSSSCESLLTIINDILDFSKIEAGHLQLERTDFDLAETVRVALELHAEAAAKKGLELVMEIEPGVPATVRGDPVRLRQVLLNLVGNAVKFTARGDVVVHVDSLAQTPADRVVLHFEVSDTGVGISRAVQATLFQPFVQADSSTTRRYGGTGLGLAICKRLVELMHGKISVVSAPGEGSIFSFTVELETAAEPAAVEPASPVSLAGRRILAVDDNAANRLLLEHLLARWGTRHCVVDSAASALAELRRAAAAREPHELVVLDHLMPDTTGLELAATIRAERTLPRPVLVLLTSHGERFTAEQLDAHGLAACEFKPVNPERLRATLSHALTRARSPRDAAPTAAVAPATPHKSCAPVLVAEDNAVNQKVIGHMLRRLGYQVDITANGNEALAALGRQAYALVLMDEQMPEMDGLEATRCIRDLEARRAPGFCGRIPIIAITADAMPGTRERCLDAGMDDYLTKPVQLDALRDLLAAHLATEIHTAA